MALPDRIDFTMLSDRRTIVLKLRRDQSDPAYPRDIPVDHEIQSAGFDIDAALAWCKDNGYAVRRWSGGARAWKGSKPWIIRTRAQIAQMRRRNPCAQIDYAYDG